MSPPIPMNHVQKTTRMILGVIFGLIGIVGLILPLIPGTPFLLLAAACFNGLEMDEPTTASEPDTTTTYQEPPNPVNQF